MNKLTYPKSVNIGMMKNERCLVILSRLIGQRFSSRIFEDNKRKMDELSKDAKLNLVSLYGEWLASRAMKAKWADRNTEGFDLNHPYYKRIQVKTSATTASPYRGFSIHKADAEKYDYLILLKLNELDFGVVSAFGYWSEDLDWNGSKEKIYFGKEADKWPCLKNRDWTAEFQEIEPDDKLLWQ